jgi:hypothetical protein
MTTIQLKRGTESNRGGVTPASGEPLVTTDTHELFIGDGSTPGGLPVGTVKTVGASNVGDLVIFKDTTGKLVEALAKADLLNGYATISSVTSAIATVKDEIVKGKVAEATKADNSDALGTRTADEYLTVDVITQSYQEDGAYKVTSAAGVKALSDATDTALSSIRQDVSDNAQLVKALSDATDTALSSIRQDVSDNAQLVKAVKANLPSKISSGTAAPSGGTSGDLYVQF